jgi:serine/threonine protein kinase
MGERDQPLLRKRYQRLELIGRGGTASVYRGRDEALGRDVAIKMYPPASGEAEAARQASEVDVLAGLSHHSLVTLFDAGVERRETGSHVYLVMELVHGSNLQQTLTREAITAQAVAEIGFDIAEGLQYLHHHGIVHRDIKPSNIQLVDYGDANSRTRAKLVDFGIAREGVAARPDLASTGTVAYSSPEQVRGEEVTGASDIYSLGLVLLECFTRELAFPGVPVASAMARLSSSPGVPAALPAEWRSLIGAMTELDPADRPSTGEVLDVVRDLVVIEMGRGRVDQQVADLESRRIDAVRRYRILDTSPDGVFDRITRLAASVLHTPIALVSIVDTDRIWFKSAHGLDGLQQIGRDPGLCATAITKNAAWIVEDARADPRVLANPLVAGEFGLQFYAGMPLRTGDGLNIGTLCVLDFEPRSMTEEEVHILEDLAGLVMREVEVHGESQREHPPLAV